MKNNKIYMLLANLYEQVKGVVGDSGRSLSEEIDRRVEEQEEVIAARKGHTSLLEKINAVDNSIDGSSQEIMEISGRINKTESDIVTISDEIDVIKTTNPTVQLENGEHLLVNVESRPSHKSSEFSLNSNEEYRTNANTEHYVSQLYVRDNIYNKEIDMSFRDNNSEYDKGINTVVSGALKSIEVGEMTLPLHLSLISNQSYDNIATLPEICDIQGITNTAYINENQHVVSAFRTGYKWHIKSKMADIIIKFAKPIYVTSIDFNFTSNTQQQSVAVSQMVGSNWVEISRAPSTDKKIDILKEVDFIKITFYSMSSSDNTYISVSDVKVNTKEYHSESGITKVTEAIDLYDLSGYATLASLQKVPNDTICKFALSSTSGLDCFAYYPSKRFLESGLFQNSYGTNVLDVLKSSVNRNYLLDYTFRHYPPSGNEGSLSIGSASWSEDISLQLSNGYLIDAINYLTVKIKVKDTVRDIPIDQSYLNKSTLLEIDDVQVNVEVKKARSGIKVSVTTNIPVPEIRYVVTSLQNLYTSGNSTSVRPYDSSTTSIESRDYSDFMKCIKAVYSTYKQLYIWWRPNSWSNYYWSYSNTTYSKYNQTKNCSIIAIDTEKVYANAAKYTKNSSDVRFDENIFTITNATSTVAYVCIGDDAHNAFIDDGSLITKDTVTQINPANEFIGCLKRDIKQKVIKMEPKQETNRLDDVEYFLSYNNYNFYTYNHENNAWIQTKDGMNMDDIIRIPSYAYEKLFTTENIYVKVKINDSNAKVSGIEIEFNKDHFKTIDESLIPVYGMNLSDIENISASFIFDLINQLSSLTVLMHSKSKLRCWPYMVPGMQLIEYGGISWSVADSSVAKQFISGNMLIIKNVAKEIRYFKLEQKFFEDTVVVVGDRLQNDIFEDAIDKMEELNENVNDMVYKFGILDQGVQLLHDAVLEGTKPPQELPTYIIPSQIEKDLPPLSPGNSTEIPNIKDLRYVQFWDTQMHPVPEFVLHKCVKELQHQYIYENGTFYPTYFEMGKYYDTDNAYLMSESLLTNTTHEFSTSFYKCTARRSDGLTQSSRSGYTSKILSAPDDAINGWWYWQWASNQGNLVYDLPGENARWIDFDFDFKEETYMYAIMGMDFGGRSANDSNSDSRIAYTWQVTSIFLDYDGSGNWVEHSSYTGLHYDRNVYIQKAIKKLRIRIEIPYTYNRGAGEVGFKHLDFYYCPVRYLHDVQAKIMPILYYNTETWKRLLSVYSDATIAGTAADIHYLFETNNELQNNRKYWGFNGSSLIEKTSATYSNGMLLQQFNNLTESQLAPLLGYRYVRPIAVLKSSDGFQTPYLRSFKMNYAEKEYSTTELVNPQDINTRYDKEAQKLIVTNATNSIKTLKAIIS